MLHKNGCSPVVITDNDHVVAAAGVSKREVMERRVTKALEDVMDARTPRIAKAPGECLQAIEGYDRPAEVAYPIVYGGDVCRHSTTDCKVRTATCRTKHKSG